MSALEPQPTESQDFTDWNDYPFSGEPSTVQRKRAFLLALRIKGSIHGAAIAARISRKSVYNWLDSDQVFVLAVSHFREDTADILETSVYERAFKDSILAMFWLKAHRPKFRDRLSVDVEAVRAEVKERLKALGLERPQLSAAAATTMIEVEAKRVEDTQDYTLASSTPVSTEQKETQE